MDRDTIEIPLENRRFKRNGRSIIIKNQDASLYFEVRDDKGKMFGRSWVDHDNVVFLRRWLGRAIRNQESK